MCWLLCGGGGGGGGGGVEVATYFLIHCLGRGNKVVKLRFP